MVTQTGAVFPPYYILRYDRIIRNENGREREGVEEIITISKGLHPPGFLVDGRVNSVCVWYSLFDDG